MLHTRHITLLLVLALAMACNPLRADSVEEINAKSMNALLYLQDAVDGVDEVLGSAAGVLVFPDVVKLGFGAGGQYGEGVLLVGGKPDGYYSTAGASFGLQLGAQTKSEVIVFLTDEALQQFRGSRGWEVGVDANVALLHNTANTRIDRSSLDAPVVGFIFSNEGLMADLSLEGSKITRLAR